MNAEQTRWHVSIRPGESRTSRNGTTIENKGDSTVRLIIIEAKTAPIPEGTEDDFHDIPR